MFGESLFVRYCVGGVCLFVLMMMSGCYRWHNMPFSTLKQKLEANPARRVRLGKRKQPVPERVVVWGVHFEDPFLKGVSIPYARSEEPQKKLLPLLKKSQKTFDLRQVQTFETYEYDGGLTTQFVLAVVLGAGFAAAMVVGVVLEVQKEQAKGAALVSP